MPVTTVSSGQFITPATFPPILVTDPHTEAQVDVTVNFAFLGKSQLAVRLESPGNTPPLLYELISQEQLSPQGQATVTLGRVPPGMWTFGIEVWTGSEIPGPRISGTYSLNFYTMMTNSAPPNPFQVATFKAPWSTGRFSVGPGSNMPRGSPDRTTQLRVTLDFPFLDADGKAVPMNCRMAVVLVGRTITAQTVPALRTQVVSFPNVPAGTYALRFTAEPDEKVPLVVPAWFIVDPPMLAMEGAPPK